MNTFAGIWIFVAAIAQMGAIAEVNVTVFYESLCPDSIRFIKKQLYPTYKALRDYMNVELVPFGKAYISTKPWSITCQHGRNECLGNAVQACALARYPDTEMQVDIVYCHMSDYDPPTAGQRCARKLNYNSDGIEECSVKEEGRQLLAQHGERTQRFRERLSFVPTILFNDATTGFVKELNIILTSPSYPTTLVCFTKPRSNAKRSDCCHAKPILSSELHGDENRRKQTLQKSKSKRADDDDDDKILP